ncbi:metallophosphoesterase family protein [Gymnodinialimonas ulvae]|uniref:metallophosphoesterase family protein n=1 Tax=Gymnodinialimonas ulvae TaxID=3126504 RepID=UPI0030B0E168
MARWKDPAPNELVYVIGDIHGCVDKLGALLDVIDDDMARNGTGTLVFVGDYIDRGAHSADVLAFVSQMTASHPDQFIALMGNHERMLLDFLANPTGPAQRWLQHGGLETLASFGLTFAAGRGAAFDGALRDTADALTEVIGASLMTWLSTLPLSWSSGDLWVVHAGADPVVAMEDQRADTLLWGADGFLKSERRDGQWVAFGHRPFDKPLARKGRIACDTGAVYGGPLSAARIAPGGGVRFLSV